MMTKNVWKCQNYYKDKYDDNDDNNNDEMPGFDVFIVIKYEIF